MPFNWQEFHTDEHRERPVVDPRHRLRICLTVFAVALLIIFARSVQLEVTQGAGFRNEALRPTESKVVLRALRGRILARGGEVLAYDRPIQCVAVAFRWLQQPPDPRWLRATARARLPRADRRKAELLASANAEVVRERSELASRLAKLCGLSADEWKARTQRIQTRVERIAADANRRQAERAESAPRQSLASDADDASGSWATWIRGLLIEDAPPPRIVVAEELSPHVVVADVPASVVEEIDTHAERYPGTTIVERLRRTYPAGALAAHVLGHLGPVDEKELANRAASRTDEAPETLAPSYLPDDLAGRMGVEQQYEAALHGRHGLAIQQSNRGRRTIASYCAKRPQPGRDISLTLDLALQRTAEELLRDASERRTTDSDRESAGGAIAVMEVRSGNMLALASNPAFDPNLFVGGETGELATLLSDKSHPLFDRVCRMAIPPGSAFKVLTAVALMESRTVRPKEPYFCQGYLHTPDQQRCEIFVRQGIGHGAVTLADALSVSCNVYFFHFAEQMGAGPLVDWAQRFGFARPTGIDLPGEASGTLPSAASLPGIEGHAWRTADTQSIAIGQGALTVTPLQMLRMIAAVANGGRLVTPHVEMGNSRTFDTHNAILGIHQDTFRAIRDGLQRVVADPQGTAHATVYLASTAIGGKTGTAETGDDRQSHAWFVGYAPAEDPKVAFVVVLEHAGDAATTAGPVAKRLVVRMEQLGLL